MARIKVGGDRTGSYDHHCSTLEDALEKACERDTIVLSAGMYEAVRYGAFHICTPGVWIEAEQEHQATLLHPVVIEAPDVKLSGLVVRVKAEGEVHLSAVFIEAPRAVLAGCKVIGKGKNCVGIKTIAAADTRVESCDVSATSHGIHAREGATVHIEGCEVTSKKEIGICLCAASNCNIIDTDVRDTGQIGIYLVCAPSKLQDVSVYRSKYCGIVCGCPETLPIEESEYFALGNQGHLLAGVTVRDCRESGLYVYPGVRVCCTGCEFRDNGDAGVFIEDWRVEDAEERKDKKKEKERKRRAEACQPIIIHDSIMKRNSGWGVQGEVPGLFHLKGHFEFRGNGKGNAEVTSGPAVKRALCDPPPGAATAAAKAAGSGPVVSCKQEPVTPGDECEV